MLSERLPISTASMFFSDPVDDKEFYKVALKSLRTRRGVIHGQFNDKGRVCAVGAVRHYVKKSKFGMTVRKEALEALQRLNDSVPNATPKERLQIVRIWLRDRVKGLPETPKTKMYSVKCMRCETEVERPVPFQTACPSCKKESINIVLKSEGYV